MLRPPQDMFSFDACFGAVGMSRVGAPTGSSTDCSQGCSGREAPERSLLSSCFGIRSSAQGRQIGVSRWGVREHSVGRAFPCVRISRRPPGSRVVRPILRRQGRRLEEGRPGSPAELAVVAKRASAARQRMLLSDPSARLVASNRPLGSCGLGAALAEGAWACGRGVLVAVRLVSTQTAGSSKNHLCWA